MTPMERLMNDLIRPYSTEPEPTAKPAQPSPSAPWDADIRNVYALIGGVIDAAQTFDVTLSKHMVAQSHQINALEEAICPRVAARLTALERRADGLTNYLDKTNFPTPDSLVARITELERAAKTTTAPAKPAKPVEPVVFAINGRGYTELEHRVAMIVGSDRPVFVDYEDAARIVKLVRGS